MNGTRGWMDECQSRMRARRRLAVLMVASGIGMGWLIGKVVAAILRAFP